MAFSIENIFSTTIEKLAIHQKEYYHLHFFLNTSNSKVQLS